MNPKRQSVLFLLVMSALSSLLFYSCANRGMGPQGGPKDETPPKVLKEKPLNGSLNVEPKQIVVEFDEYIQLDKVSDNVLVSPPQQRPPEVKAVGKKLQVNFAEPLLDSTTYTIDFGAAICDNNEKNVFEGYSFSFSTGDVIDTMQISGLVLNAEDLNPISGVIIGVHTDTADSALTTMPFTRIARTDSEGFFSIKNLKHGTYRLHGLQDVSKDYLYQPGEGLVIYDSLLTPVCHQEWLTDTLWTDSLTVDTVTQQLTTVYEPDNLLLFFFREDKQRHYFVRALREQPHYFTLYFAAPQDSLPQLQPIGDDWMQYAICQPNLTNDTIVYWLVDSAAIKMDTIAFEMTYLKSDSVYQLQPQTDTVRAIYRAPRISEKARRQMERNKKTPRVAISTNGKSPFEIYTPLQLNTATPLTEIDRTKISLYQEIDSLKKPLSFSLVPTDSASMHYEISYPWEAESTYGIAIDSAALTDVYGSVNEVFTASFKIRSLDEYSTLVINVEPFTPQAMIQILDEKDQVVRTLPALEGGTKFQYLSPKSYYVRMFIDYDGNGVWTTGDFLLHRHPEPVYYFHSKLTLRANWDFEETIRYLERPQDEQKPDELIKDAAAAKK